MSTIMDAARRRDGSAVNHIERRMLSLIVELNDLADQLSSTGAGRPGPRAGMSAIRRARFHIRRASEEFRRSANAIDEQVRAPRSVARPVARNRRR